MDAKTFTEQLTAVFGDAFVQGSVSRREYGWSGLIRVPPRRGMRFSGDFARWYEDAEGLPWEFDYCRGATLSAAVSAARAHQAERARVEQEAADWFASLPVCSTEQEAE